MNDRLRHLDSGIESIPMSFNVKDAETDRLVRELAFVTGESLTEAIRNAARERLGRVRRRPGATSLSEELEEIALRCAALPVLNHRSEDEILGYGEEGLPS